MYLNKLLEKANHHASKTHKGGFSIIRSRESQLLLQGIDSDTIQSTGHSTGNKGDCWLSGKKPKVTGKKQKTTHSNHWPEACRGLTSSHLALLPAVQMQQHTSDSMHGTSPFR